MVPQVRHLQQGSKNPEYKSTQQDLPDSKKGEDSGMQAEGVKVRLQQETRTHLRKSTKVDPYFQLLFIDDYLISHIIFQAKLNQTLVIPAIM